MKTTLYYLPPFSNFISPHPWSFCCFASLAECVFMPDLMWYLLNYNYYGCKPIEPWYLSPGSTWLCVSCNKALNLLKICHKWHGFCLHSDLITHTYKTQGHTGTNRMTLIHKYILTPPFTCTQKRPALRWMINLLIQNFT